MPSYEQVRLAVDRIPPGPWVYARLTDDFGPDGPVAGDGSIVEVVDRAGRFCGHALYNSTSDIRLRMLSRGRKSDLDRPRQHLQRLIAAALRLRRRVLGLDQVTDAYRIVHAEG
ncbi:MAG: RlmI/RlmK family 23S rRNA methyltransferase, partial [Planctomycetota bacterium]